MVLVRLVHGGGTSRAGSENLKKISKKNRQFFLKCTHRLYIGKTRSRIFWVSKKKFGDFGDFGVLVGLVQGGGGTSPTSTGGWY